MIFLVDNIKNLTDKIESYSLSREVLLPKFDIPDEFIVDNDSTKQGENKYLRYLAYEGAKKRYKEITDEIKERIDFELQIIENSGYPGYFLIIQDLIKEARNMNVSVGPEEFCCGSVVAYCTEITNDPIGYTFF